MAERRKVVKLVFVGDECVGKSCFLIRATTSHFQREYIPTVFDNLEANLTINGLRCWVGLWDTAGQADYDRLRPLSYYDTDVFVVCFDVANRRSFKNVTMKWIPEIHYHAGSPIILLLATKTDLRDGNSTSWATVSTREGEAFARALGVSFAECSSLNNDGVQAALEKATELAVEKNVTSKAVPFFRRRSKNSTSVKFQEVPVPPDLPPAGSAAPHIEVLSSTFATDWHSMMSDTKSADVRFLFSDGQSVEAHKTVLSASLSIFLSTIHVFEDVSWVHEESNHHPVDIEGHHQCQNQSKTVIRLHESISKPVFLKVLAFLYTGSLDIAEDEDKNFVKEIQVVAEKFRLAFLSDICTNLLEGAHSFLNVNIGSWLNNNLGQAVKHMFLNKPFRADVQFCVEGTIVYGHRTILKARSEVMAAMLGEAFRESDLETEIEIKDASLQSFLALLEYLYTDHAPIEEGDSVEIMILADRFCLPRLVTLCELYIVKNVDLSFRERVADGTSDVINLLHISQAHNAKQLSCWCLHFISTHISVFESTKEFALVQGENRKHINELRWPPLSFLEAQKEFERKLRKLDSKCKVM